MDIKELPYKEINDMTEEELKYLIQRAKETLKKWRVMRQFGYDSYEITPKINNLCSRKKKLEAKLKELRQKPKETLE
jgi:hypothetical protein